jgi:hypothetical protein
LRYTAKIVDLPLLVLEPVSVEVAVVAEAAAAVVVNAAGVLAVVVVVVAHVNAEAVAVVAEETKTHINDSLRGKKDRIFSP